MNYRALAESIVAKLELSSPPVALTFVVDPPAGMPETAAEVPSACSFWIRAEKEVFYAPAERHFNCPVGAMVMGFDLPAATQKELKGLVESMCQCGYLATRRGLGVLGRSYTIFGGTA